MPFLLDIETERNNRVKDCVLVFKQINIIMQITCDLHKIKMNLTRNNKFYFVSGGQMLISLTTGCFVENKYLFELAEQ